MDQAADRHPGQRPEAAEERLERLKSAAQLERRKLELAARQEVLTEAFDQALEQLCTLPMRSTSSSSPPWCRSL